jgi:hypothetical protein
MNMAISFTGILRSAQQQHTSLPWDSEVPTQVNIKANIRHPKVPFTQKGEK